MNSRLHDMIRVGTWTALLAVSGLSLQAVAQPPPGAPPGPPPGPEKPVTTPKGPVTYTIDPNHTYPSFEADHRGISYWRGKFNHTTGTVVLDQTGKTGTLDITVDMNSVDFGHEKMNEHAKSPDIFDVAKYPTATYKGTFAKFKGEAPTKVTGELTLHGVTKAVNLKINKFVCKPGMMNKGVVCGGDASTTFSRSDFGVNFGVPMGFDPTVRLQIQVEANRQ
jgi:polyisoprenoid-binding protein YceI